MGQSTRPPSKDKTCCCCCLWLPLPWRPPRPSGIRMWFRICTTSTLLPIPTVSTLTLLATRCTMLQDTLETWLPVPSGLFHFPMSRTQRLLFRLPPPPVEGPLRAQLRPHDQPEGLWYEDGQQVQALRRFSWTDHLPSTNCYQEGDCRDNRPRCRSRQRHQRLHVH